MGSKILNHAKVTFISNSHNEGFARVAVASFFASLDPTIEELMDIKTAVSEAVTNAIVHGYRGTKGNVIMEMKIIENNKAYIKVSDKGCGIPDVEQAMEPLFTTAEHEERAGLGFAVMQSFMDKVKVRSKVGKGTTVVFTKTIGQTQEEM